MRTSRGLAARVESEAFENRAAELAAELQSAGPVLCAIVTRYKGPTDTRGARIVAELAGGAGRPRVAVPYPYALDDLGRHTLAALALVEKLREDSGDVYAGRIVRAAATRDGYAFALEY